MLAANRDEFFDRPSAKVHFWPDFPGILAGRDLQAGGGWLGVNRSGMLAALTNFRRSDKNATPTRSRGHIVREFLNLDTEPVDYLSKLRQEKTLYQPFNFLFGKSGALFFCSSEAANHQELSPGIYGLSNGPLDSKWPKCRRAASTLEGVLELPKEHLIEAAFDLLRDKTIAPESELPKTGIGVELETKLSSVFISAPERNYGTRASSVLLIGDSGSVVFAERTFDYLGNEIEAARVDFLTKR